MTASYQSILLAELQVQGVTGFTSREKQWQTRDPPSHQALINPPWLNWYLLFSLYTSTVGGGFVDGVGVSNGGFIGLSWVGGSG